ncbi:MAG TPA: class I SAM-dependent methyltransferase [Flavobacteriaceae bacterium]|nr:class I SAM-dependent methyltransferase [Flavobacteriaceae bacterium]HEX5743491.1 class I SAM-dependent methyltransferase [Flavobacteriaceae bacterium]
MKKEQHYIKINKQSWNHKVDFHIKSKFYDLEGFLNGNTSLNEIELQLLNDIKGKSILHLQCHFGQDSISLSRLGAHVVGVDFSDKAIEKAKELTKKTNTHTTFICCDIYELPNYLDKQFDIVFTSYGTIGWLPDLNKWAQVIAKFLKPNGKFIFVDFHPVVWMFDDNFDKIGYNYFNSGAIIETLSGTYADKEAAINQEYVMWNHSISEILNSLIKNNLEINSFDEFDYSPYNCFNNTVEFEPKKYRIKQLENKIPMLFALVGTKKDKG